MNGAFNPIGGDDLNHEFVVIATDEMGCRDTSEEFFFSPSQIQLDLLTISDYSGFQISCNQGNDGFIEVQNVGGFAPIISEWNTGEAGLSVNGLTAGYYSIISTDAQGCQDTIFQELMEPTAITTVVTGTSDYNGSNVSCFGSADGYISFGVYGGVQPYVYTFDNLNFDQSLFENINGGVHDFVISDANNCPVNQTVSLTEPAPLTIDISVVSNYNGADISCFGAFDGQAQAQVSGGTAPYFYQWSDGSIAMLSDIDLGQGAVHLDIVDINGCTTFGQINLMEPAPLVLTTAVTSNYNGFGVSCLGSANGSVTSYPSGGTGAYIFDWNDGASSLQNLNNVQAGLFQLELTDQNGCGPIFSSVLVTEPDSLVLNLIVTSNFNGYHISCNSAADGIVQSDVNGGVLPYQYDWNGAIDGISNAFDLTAGTVELTVTDDNDCQAFGSIQLEEPPALLIQIASVSNFNGYGTSCFNSQDGILFVSATGGIGSYIYTWDNGVNGSINAGLGSGIYSVEVIDGNGCVVNESTTLYSPTPILGQVESQSNYNGFEVSCFGGADGEVNLSALGGVEPYYFLWPDGVVSSLHQNLTAGTYSVQVEDVNGCQQNIQVDISQPNSLDVSIVSVSEFNGFEISCFNATDGFIHASVTGGVAPFIYQWTSGVSASPELNNIPVGNYGLTVLDNNGCVSDAVSQLMEQPNALFANIYVVSNYNGSQISCFGLSDAQAEVSIGGGVDPYYPEWEDGSTQFLSNVNLNAGLHQVTYVDANGCDGSLTFSVIEPEPVVASVQSIIDYNGYEISCYGYNDGAVVVTCEGGTGVVSALWNDGFSGYYHTSMLSGTYSAACTDLNGCMIDDQVVLDQPTPLSLDLEVFSDFNGWNISCYGYADGQALCNVVGGVGPYSYNWEDGSIIDFSNQDLSAGTFTVQVTDLNGCYIEDSITLTQPDAITHTYQVSDFSGFGVSCFGGSNGSIDVTAFGGASPLSYVWSSGQFTQDLFSIPSGVYALEISDANGCPSQFDLIELTQPDEIILETVLTSNYNGYNVSCFNSTDGFAEVIVYGGVPDYNINWDNGDQGLLADQLSGGIHLVTVNDANGCVDVEQLFMDVPSPIVLSQASLPDTCFLGLGSSTIAASGGVGDYLYLWNNGGMLPASCCLTSGDNAWVTVIDDNFCQLTMNINVDNIPPPNVSLEIATDYPICEDSTEVVLFANTLDEYVNWRWYFNGEIQLDESGVLPIVFNEPHDVEVELVGSFANGCSSSVSQVLEVEPIATLYVPNAFTPDDDYINDGFVVRGSQLLSYHIMIFDRWGQLYFESDDIKKSWNGTRNNSMENAKSDVYMYRIEAMGVCGEEFEKVGHVILLR
jgi:gliding motility-associated-like protein